MFKKSFIAAAAVIATTGSAFAMDAPSQGAEMLARLAGVQPGAYTTNDLVRLGETDSNAETRFILSDGLNALTRRSNNVVSNVSTSAGADQLAALAGVASGTYSTTEILLLGETDSNAETAYILNGGLRNETGSTVSASPARQQLAGALHVNAADFTLAQLVQLDSAVSENDQTTIKKILSDAGVDKTVAQILR